MMAQALGESMATSPDLLLGRKTYEIFAAYWPYHPDEPSADNLNHAKKYVVSRTLDQVDWNNSTLIKGDVVNEISKFKELSGPELQVSGSNNLIQTLLKNNLIDELHLWIFPVALGNGKRFFGEHIDPSNFKLLDTKISSTGVIIARYERAGALKAGSFVTDNHPS